MGVFVHIGAAPEKGACLRAELKGAQCACADGPVLEPRLSALFRHPAIHRLDQSACPTGTVGPRRPSPTGRRVNRPWTPARLVVIRLG